jgi:putative ABC transport system permease protein
MNIFIGILEQGLVYAFLAVGLYIAYIILDFPDLSVDGTFPLGAAVGARLISLGINPFVVLIISFLAGSIAGIVTGFIHIKLKVKDLLAGLIVQTGLYTINLTIVGRANLPIFQETTIFNNAFVSQIIPESLLPFKVLIVSIPIIVFIKILLDKFLQTKRGYLLKATGDNPMIVKSLAKDPGLVKVQGLAISNGFVALSGCLVMQEQRFFEISMGTGSMVMGLASVVLGMKLFKKVSFLKGTTIVILGSIVYKACIALAIKMGLSANSMKLITAALFLIILVLGEGNRKKVKNACA